MVSEKSEEGEDPPKPPPSHQILLLQVQVQNPPQENIPININMICLYLSLMGSLNYPCMMVNSIPRCLITGSDRWTFIVVCNKSRMRQLKSNWHRFDLQAQHSSHDKESCKMECNKLVMYFHHGKFLFLHLENNFILWVIWEGFNWM